MKLIALRLRSIGHSEKLNFNMQKRHYFIGGFDLAKNDITCLDTEIVHQISSVLKLKIDEEVVLGDGQGRGVVAKISQISKKEIIFSKISDLPAKNNDKKVVLFAAALKRDSFEWLLQKATEVGVSEIVPLITDRTIKTGFNHKRWEKIVKEAAEQSQNLWLPTIGKEKSLKEALQTAEGLKVFFDPVGKNFQEIKKTNNTISLFIGPEGGFSERELELVKNSEVVLVNLGDAIMRAETAATVAVYLAKNIF